MAISDKKQRLLRSDNDKDEHLGEAHNLLPAYQHLRVIVDLEMIHKPYLLWQLAHSKYS